MNSRVAKLALLFSLASIATLSQTALAQQVTYYTFNDAVNNSGGCELPNGPANPLLCLNAEVSPGYSGLGQNIFPSVSYPANLDPNPNDNTTFYNEFQMNPAQGGNGESAWFSQPQKVTNGFTNYFALRMTGSADGIAFVIQNAQGGGSGAGANFGSPCNEAGSSVLALGSSGGCMGYGGIDNSLAIEFDTFRNDNDPQLGQDQNPSGGGANHIAIQSCGTAPNSPSHNAGGCKIALNNTLPFNMANGQIHEVVVEYSGTPANANTPNLFVYLDPPFVQGTHTPCTDSQTCPVIATPVLSVVYDLGANLNLIGGDSAYVGFTAATGAVFQSNELLAWTYTPHTPVVQQQPISNPDTPTTFPFGDHTYAVTYSSADPPTTSTSGIDMIVDANTISPAKFLDLITNTPFAGSACQIYQGTGGNCIIYSVHCIDDTSKAKVACPSTSDPTIAVKTAYESDNNTPPTTPGFLQGDPFFSQIATITGDGTTATVTCTGECALTVVPPATTQTVTIADNSVGGFNGTFAVTPDPVAVDKFTFPSTVMASGDNPGTGGYVTSNNVHNICNTPPYQNDPNLPNYNPPCWQAQRIDGTTSGKTKNFSDLVALSTTVTTVAPTVTFSGAPASAAYQSSFNVTATTNASVLPTITPAGSCTVGPVSGSAASASATVTMTSGSGTCSLTANWAADTHYTMASAAQSTGATKLTPMITWNPAPITLGTALGVAQLDATASVPGTFVYSPVAGTVVSTTSQMVSTMFTPSVPDNYYPANASVALSVVAGPVAMVSPSSIDFGTVYLASINARIVTVTNIGNAPMTVTGPLLSLIRGGNSKEFVEVNLCPKSLAAGKSCTLAVTFIAGPYYTPQTATLSVMDNAPGNPQSVTLTASVINPQASLSTASLSFGNQAVGTSSATKTVTVKNTGATPLLINRVTVTGANSGDFLASSGCPGSLGAGSSCTIGVVFKPTAKGSRSAALAITDNALIGTQIVLLSGKGN